MTLNDQITKESSKDQYKQFVPVIEKKNFTKILMDLIVKYKENTSENVL